MRKPDYILDLSTLKVTDDASARPGFQGRPWIAVYFKCCHRYARVYRNAAGTAYAGRCPGCHRLTTARIGPDGTDARFFEAL